MRRWTTVIVLLWIVSPVDAAHAAADEFQRVWASVAQGIPAEYEAQGKAPSGPREGEQKFVRSAPGSDGGRAVNSSLTLILVNWGKMNEADLKREQASAKAAGAEPIAVGDFGAFKYPPPPKPRDAGGRATFRRPPPVYHGEMSILVIEDEWRFRITLEARRSHYEYDEAKRFMLTTAQALHERLGMATAGGEASSPAPATTKQALQYATRIVLAPGEKVDPELSDAKAWQAYIDAQVKARGQTLPDGFENVAATFAKVGESMTLADGRKMNWPALLVQSIHETGFFRYGRRADAKNFNVAGLGITEDEGTTTRQKFDDLEQGVTAFFQHMSVYGTGQKIDDPLAQRTKLSQGTVAERVTNLSKNFPDRGPIALRDLGSHYKGDATTARKWSGLDPNTTTDAQHIAHVKQRIADAHKKYGGGTLGYSGDPLYCAKVMDMWLKATAEVRRLARQRHGAGDADASP